MSSLNLIAHCGAQHVSRDEVMGIQAPKPMGTRHLPIPHGQFLTTIDSQLEKVGLRAVQEVHAVGHEGQRYFGMMEVVNGTKAGEDYGTVLGFRNANDQTFTAGLLAGSGVFVCDNLCFSGEIKVGRKHTLNILRDLPTLIFDALGRVGALRTFQSERIEAYKRFELTDSRVNDLLIESLDLGVIASSKIGKVLGEWREPSHEEFAESKNGWRLMNAFTEVMKPRLQGDDLFTLPAKTEVLHSILDRACEVKATVLN